MPSARRSLHAGPLRDEGRRDHVAGVTPLLYRAVQHVAGAARFVATRGHPVPSEAIEESLELREIISASGRGVSESWRRREAPR